MKRKFVIVGKKNSGKTEVADFIEKSKYKKTNSLDLIYREKTVEIPSEYLEVNYLNNAIIMISQNQALATLFLIAVDDESVYPPNFCASFTGSCATIITKIDLVCKSQLKEIYDRALEVGSENIFSVSFKTGEGLEELSKYIERVRWSK